LELSWTFRLISLLTGILFSLHFYISNAWNWSQLAEEFGWGFFWLFIFVTGPIVARFIFIPFRFLFYSGQSLGASFWQDAGSQPNKFRTLVSIVSMAVGLWLSGQIAIAALTPMFQFISGELAFENTLFVVFLSVIVWVLSQFFVLFVFPFVMLPFMVLAKGTENYSATYWAIAYRAYIRGVWPFMSWTLHQTPQSEM
jgi:hypothetical protein